jgi:putative transposase
MPRLPRLCPPGLPLHIVQRGHNRQICFASTVDYATYARRLQEAALRCEVRLHAWVFMTNYVHLLQCYRYIELNPVRAGMVANPADYACSSYRCNALGVHSDMLSPHPNYLALAPDLADRLRAYRDLFRQQLPAQLVHDIRDATNRNLALGSTRFKSEIEATLARRVTPGRPGRKRKEM